MQSRAETGRHHRWKLLRIPVRIALIFACIIPAAIQKTPECIPNNPARLPEAPFYWDSMEDVPSTEASRALKQAVNYYNSNRYDSALEALPRVVDSSVPGIGDYIWLYRAKSKYMMERQREAIHDFLILESRYPGSPLVHDAKIGRCQAYLQLKEPRAALTVLGSLLPDESAEYLYCRA